MKREWLKELGLEADIIDKIMDENGKDVNKAKGEAETLKTKNTELEAQLTTASATIEDLTKGAKTKEELEVALAQYKKDLEKIQTESDEKLFNSELEKELIKLNVHSAKAAKAELELEKIKYENGQFTGLKEQTDLWPKEKPFLIKTGEKQYVYNPQGGSSSQLDLKSAMEQKDFNFTDWAQNQKLQNQQ
jgi:hypothetical protein